MPSAFPASNEGRYSADREVTLAQPALFAQSAKFRSALAQLERYARHDSVPILLEGESGTGKTYLARAVHRSSPRRSRVFSQVNLASLDDSLASSDLFGHVVGAFTDARQSRAGHFVTASGGTLFLDEIGKTSAAVQRKLLHVVEAGEVRPVGADRTVRVDVRLVLASNTPLETLVASGDFLPDLLARIGLFRIRLPSLRERRADIPGLVTHFVETRAPALGYARSPTVDPDLLRALQGADWPYNLRELDAAVQRLLIEADGASVISPTHCRGDLARFRGQDGAGSARLTRSDVERAVASAGTKAGAATMLGVSRMTVHRYLKPPARVCGAVRESETANAGP